MALVFSRAYPLSQAFLAKRFKGSCRTRPCQGLPNASQPLMAKKGTKAAQAANKPAKAKQAPPETPVQKQEAETDFVSPAKRKMPKRDIDSMVDKMIRDNFRNWPAQQVCVFLVNGLSLRQVLLRDKAAVMKSDLKKGKTTTNT